MISVENATFTYPGAASPILRNVSFEVPERSLLAILGPNGAGKTTLLRTMIGLQKWDSGRTLIDGTPISSMSPGRWAVSCPTCRRPATHRTWRSPASRW